MFINTEPILLDQFVSRPIDATCGGSAYFVGRVRNHHEGKEVLYMEYEAYKSMANKKIGRIVDDAKAKFNLDYIYVQHRVGKLQIGDIAVAIEASAAHRDEAFKACRYVIDVIKKHVPIWKYESYADGTHNWVLCSHTNTIGI
ncbi:MAG: molybdopterin synthase catalytic subunit [Candidatus Omnitrophota bacterium]|jgi:molybdopterin synthase catalytic subunit